MTLDEYVRDPAPAPSLSPSVAHKLLSRSARHAWLSHPRLNPAWQPEASSAMDLGTMAHALLLENDMSRLSVVEAPDWRGKLAQEARKDARSRGKIPLLVTEHGELMLMIQAAKKAIQDAPEIRKAFADGEPERTFMWEEDGYWCRCRPDWMTNDFRLAIDYKTTGGSAEPDAWGRGQLLNMGYDLQAAFGLRALRTLHKPRDCSFVFMVQETDAPYAVSFVGLSPEFESFAERKRAHALEVWKFCVQTDTWPGYPARVTWAEPPAYAVTRWEERQLVGGVVDEL